MSEEAEAHPVYRSFWMAGFEGADHLNRQGQALDMVAVTGHDRHVDEDYGRMSRLGIRTARESIGWRLTERPWPASGSARFDFARVVRFSEAARRHGVQILWALMHYGTPDSVSLLDDSFVERFADFAAAVARRLRPLTDETPVYTPINEISFLAWAVAETDLLLAYGADSLAKRRAKAAGDLGFAVKCRLVKGALAAIAAIRTEDPRARLLHIEPLVHVVAPADAPHRTAEAAEVSGWQWQAFDMLGGTLCPELGGSAEALDLIGVNYYHDCQWQLAGGGPLDWHQRDPRRVPLAALLRRAAHRYARPLILAETSHVGSGRGAWLDDVAKEVRRARASGVRIDGVCLYPAIDRPDWNDTAHWHRSGLWDVLPDGSRRRLNLGYAKTLRRWQRRLPAVPPAAASSSSSFASGTSMPHLVAFSHLRWDFVYQRPQHLLSRLAADFSVVFIEEPVRCDAPAWLERSSPAPGVEVLRPHTPVDAGGFHDDQLPVLEPLIVDWLAREGVADYAIWLYTPMALPLLKRLAPCAVVYDCMDELSAFKGAPRQMRQRETALLKCADLVLTGGPSLYEARRSLHENVLCLPSGVDASHYANARATADSERMREAAALQGALGTPRLGFFGVIDERLDIGLVVALADAEPCWQIVLVGPVVKIDPAHLPRRANLHWLGQQPYAVLPQLIAGWQVALLPFALNESTRFISPTKTLEYMAAGKPVVSTPIRDVGTMFGDLVQVASGAPAFVEACRKAIAETAEARARREALMAARVARHSWTEAVATIREALFATLAKSANPLAVGVDSSAGADEARKAAAGLR